MRAACNATCPVQPPSYKFNFNDYSGLLYQNQWAYVCCLQYTVAYFTSGFSLLSVAAASSSSVAFDALFNYEILNLLILLVTISIALGMVVFALERNYNTAFSRLGGAVYWSVTTMTTVLPR